LTRTTKRVGNNHALKFEGDRVELDALPAAEPRRLVREYVERHISAERFPSWRPPGLAGRAREGTL
jgi:hypothetical protein